MTPMTGTYAPNPHEGSRSEILAEMVHAQRYEGRFFGRRVNCEQVPFLPAWAVAQVLDDLSETPCLLVWKDSAGTVQECVHITPHSSHAQIATNELRIWAERDVETGEVEIQRDDGTTDIIRTLLRRPLPRNGASARLLICPQSGALRLGARRTVQHQRRAVRLAVPGL